MAGVRTDKLGRVDLVANQQAIVFTCPPAHVTIVKTVYFFSRATTAADFFLQLRPTAGNDVPLLHQSIPLSTTGFWEGWAVLEPGDSLGAFSSQSGVTVWASGSVLPEAIV